MTAKKSQCWLLITGLLWYGSPAFAQERPLFDPDYRALVPATQAMKLVSSGGGCSTVQETLSGLRVTSTWEISPEQADAMEPALAFRLARAIEASDWMPPQMKIGLSNYQSVSNHALQFVGVVIDDKKFMLINGAEAQMYDFNGIHQNFPPKGKWREGEAAIGICDGGPSNFSVLYDVDAKTFGPFALSKIGGLGTYIPNSRYPEMH